MRNERRTSMALVGTTLLALAACDSSSGDPFGPGGGDASVSGSVESASSSAPPALAPSASSGSVTGTASTVVIGEVSSNGTFEALAEAAVEADGTFRLTGVPAHRTELLIRARNEVGATVGSVVLHETTVPGGEHHAPPINHQTSLHAETWLKLRTSAASGQAMGSAELALFLHGREGQPLPDPGDEPSVIALAEASVRAQQAITAVLAAEGHPMDASSRNHIFLSMAADRDHGRAAGAGAEATQQTFIGASVAALDSAGVALEALALAWAAGTSAWDVALEGSGQATSRVATVRQGILLNLEARKRAAASIEGAAETQASTLVSALTAIEAEVRSAATIEGIESALADGRVSLETGLTSSIVAGLPGLPGAVLGSIQAALAASFTNVDLSAKLATAATAAEKAEAVVHFRAELVSAAEALVDELPDGASALAEVELMAQLLFCIGATPAIG